MLVYGERERLLRPVEALDAIVGALSSLTEAPEGLERHAALVAAFLDLGALAQGLADAAFQGRGEDDPEPVQAAAMHALVGLARPIVASWRAGFRGALAIDPSPVRALLGLGLPPTVTAKSPEGFAYYAVYPEAYIEAAAQVGAPATVVGLRSIGTSLAAVVAAALDVSDPVTVRPIGHPFQRELRLSPRLQARLTQPGEIVLVDEGPGLSGSSFGAVAHWLEAQGVASERIAFMPSHGGAPGRMASDTDRRRWARVRRPVVTFDDIALGPGDPRRRLDAWVQALTGPAEAPLRDLSAGAWRALRYGDDEAAWPPACPGQERRKFLLRTDRGAWLLKFAGLGRAGRETFERALRLGRAGLTPMPLGLRHGFLVEPWIEGASLDAAPRAQALGALLRYLAFRAEAFPAQPHEGAGEGALKTMIEVNIGEALGAKALRTLQQAWPRALRLRPIRTDGRLHRWEWLRTPEGRLLKTDAVDHDDAHDLIGCQDLAWDVAGAEMEFGLSPAETRALIEGLAARGHPIDADVLRFMRMAYPAFQLGLWSEASANADPREQARIAPLVNGYARRLETLAAGAQDAPTDAAPRRHAGSGGSSP